MGRKVFISVLGTGLYEPCKYVSTDFKSSETRFIQQATLEYLGVNEWMKTDIALFVLTEGARKLNWDVKERYDFKKKKDTVYIGLKYVIEDMNLPFVSTLSIPDGKDESEMWEIFQKIFDVLHDGDELYFDLTHSFRYLPMLVLVLGNYAKFLKHVMIKFITYGNFEARNELNEAPIVDLLPLSNLQDWTFAAGQYLDDGHVNKLIDLSKNNDKLIRIINSLQNVIYERQLCRGISIIESTTFKELKDSMMALVSTDIRPLNPIFDKIKQSFRTFDEKQNIMNGYAASKWCYGNKLYQQTITLLLETMFTDVCVSLGLDWKRRKIRDIAAASFYIVANNIPESGWTIREEEGSKKYTEVKELYLSMTNSERIQDLLDLYKLAYDIRNDIDHAGMRNDALPPDGLIEEFDKLIDKIPC